MKLTPEQRKEILERLDQFWPKPRVCPICHSETWLMQPRLFVHLIHGGLSTQPVTAVSTFPLEQEALPALLFNCGTCGYVATFLAANFGLEV